MNRVVGTLPPIASLVILPCLLLAGSGCSGSDGGDSAPPDTEDGATAPDGEPEGDGNPGRGPEITPDTTPDGPFYPLEAVPPALLAGDLSTCANGFDGGDLTPGQHEGYEVGGQVRSFYVRFPDGDAFGGPRPLMVLFNGTGGTGNGAFDHYGGQTLLDSGWVVLAPDSNANGKIWPSWDSMLVTGEQDGPNPDLDLFDSLLGCVAGQTDIDENRLYVAGHSAGGIMTNFVLQRRSDLLAGGIVASGLFDLTQPVPDLPLGELFVIVTWGGDNDSYSGDSESENTDVPNFNFVEQASIASAFYENAEGNHQIHCQGEDLGHAWLEGSEALMFDALTHHPKGLANHDAWNIDQAPEVEGSVCSEDAFTYVPPVQSVCGESSVEDCQAYCQLLADCVVENATVAPILGPGLLALGFAGEDFSDCGGCLSICEADSDAGGEGEAEVLACFASEAAGATCGPGISGAMPAISAINGCCITSPDSAVCTRACESVLLVSVAEPFFDKGCVHWMPEPEDGDGG